MLTRTPRTLRRLHVEPLEARTLLAVQGVGDVEVVLFAEDVQQGSNQGPTSLAFDSQDNLFVTTSYATFHPLKILKFPAGSSAPASDCWNRGDPGGQTAAETSRKRWCGEGGTDPPGEEP